MVGRGIESAYYKVKNLEERLSKYKIKAPFDGILVKGNISEGAYIVPNQMLGEFIDPNNFEVGVNIPVNLIEKIRLNQSASIISSGKSNDIMGKIIFEQPIVNKDAGHYNFKWNGKNQLGKNVPAGMYFFEIYADDFRQTKKKLIVHIS